MRIIALDAYGSDLGPAAMAEGALEALELDPELKILFFGDEQELSGILAGKEHERLTIVHAPDKITNDDSPTLSVRRKLQSSLVMAMKAVKDGQACGVVSAGSTGAILAGGIFRVGRIRGVHRPALCPVLPQVDGSRALLIDSGANVDCKPEYLMQFALMGSIYMEKMLGISNPRVGLLNIGAESEKGNALTHAVYPMLEASSLNFVGNVEARDALFGKADVIVADGFDGNILLKGIEGAILGMFGILKTEFSANLRSKMGAGLLLPGLKKVKKMMDADETGGATLIGVEGNVIKAHGSSKPHAIARAIAQAALMEDTHMVETIREGILEQMKEKIPEENS
ncbi:MAG: phosphate acyltransferase PlsX [Clostridia bacterium]|nr:phosphate acyltransferase PlsX [Clostridia bacterium]